MKEATLLAGIHNKRVFYFATDRLVLSDRSSPLYQEDCDLIAYLELTAPERNPYQALRKVRNMFLARGGSVSDLHITGVNNLDNVSRWFETYVNDHHADGCSGLFLRGVPRRNYDACSFVLEWARFEPGRMPDQMREGRPFTADQLLGDVFFDINSPFSRFRDDEPGRRILSDMIASEREINFCPFFSRRAWSAAEND